MLISVIVPIYNVVLEKFKECMYSLQNQTLKDIEIILVDDCGEMRECIDYANELVQADNRIILLKNNQNQGAGFSRNSGIKIAQGEYLSFVDADDKIDLDFYEKLYRKVEEKKFDIIKGDVIGVKGSLNNKIRTALSQGKPLFGVFNWQHWSAIYRTAFITENDISYGLSRVSQDVTFLLKVTVFAHSIAIVDDAFYHYNRQNEHSLTHTLLSENIYHYCKAIEERMEFLVRYVDYNDPAFMDYVDFNAERLSARAHMLVNSGISNDKYLVSVVVPTYNAEDYLPDLISSLRNQTLQDIEIIFVDDGSTDMSAIIIEQALQEDKRISYYYQENEGAGVARNTGINHAKGKYVICIDADDLYDAIFLEELYKAGESSGADVIMCLFRRYNYWTNTQTENEGYKKEKLPLERGFCASDIPKFCDYCNPGPINKMYRRRFIIKNQLRYSSTHIANDVFFGYSSMILAQKIYCLPQNLLTVRRYVNPNSISATRQKYLEESIKAVDELWNWAENKKIMDANYKKQFLKIFVNTSIYNAQYEITEPFWDAWCIFIQKMIQKDVSLKELQTLFDIDTYKFETLLGEAKSKNKEIQMLENKTLFIKKARTYLSSLKMPESLDLSPASTQGVLPETEKNTMEIKKEMASKSDSESCPQKSLFLKFKLLLARFWPVTIKRFNLTKAEERRFQLQQAKELRQLISKQDKQIKDTQKMVQMMCDSMRVSQENTGFLLNNIAEKLCDYDNVSHDMGILLNDIKSVALESKETIQENKATTDTNDKYIREILYAEIFNSTTQKSDWLQDKVLSPGHWAVGYQYLYPMYRVLSHTKPKSVLEFGLGQSTRMISQYAQYYDAEHIIIEHDEKWAEFFQEDFAMPENSRIELCELTFMSYKKAESVRVYKDLKAKIGNKKFDVISIDAPMGSDMTQYARIDILGILPDCLSENFVIMFDDCNRNGEQHTLREIEKCLKKNMITYKKGIYRGIKDTVLICAEHLRFLATM